MDTPEKQKFLETVRGLRKEAEEKLTGNRHYLAIQKLDEIAEAVENRAMSPEEMGAIRGVLSGETEAADTIEAGDVPQEAQDSGNEAAQPAQTADVTVAAAAVAAVGVAAVSATETLSAPEPAPSDAEVQSEPPSQDDLVEAVSGEELVVEELTSDTGEAIEAEVAVADPVELPASEVNILPNWWRNQAASDPVAAEPQVIEEVAAEVEQIPVAPEVGADALEEVIVEQVEPGAGQLSETPETGADDQGGVDLSTLGAGAVAVAAAGVAATKLVADRGESEDVQIIEEPAPEPALEMEPVSQPGPEPEPQPEPEPASEAEPAPEVSNIELPPVETPPVAPVVDEIFVEERPAEPEPAVVLEESVVGDENIPPALEGASPEVEIPEVSARSLGLEIPTGDVLETPIVEPIAEEAPSETPVEASPEVDTAPEPAEPASEEGNIQAAAIAAGAAAAAVATAATVAATDETQKEPAAPEAPEKLSFPDTPPAADAEPVADQQAGDTATGTGETPAPTVLDGETLRRHPAYGGERGGLVRRFVNTLRGKDYI